MAVSEQKTQAFGFHREPLARGITPHPYLSLKPQTESLSSTSRGRVCSPCGETRFVSAFASVMANV